MCSHRPFSQEAWSRPPCCAGSGGQSRLPALVLRVFFVRDTHWDLYNQRMPLEMSGTLPPYPLHNQSSQAAHPNPGDTAQQRLLVTGTGSCGRRLRVPAQPRARHALLHPALLPFHLPAQGIASETPSAPPRTHPLPVLCWFSPSCLGFLHSLCFVTFVNKPMTLIETC